jgi:hypothetical protein
VPATQGIKQSCAPWEKCWNYTKFTPWIPMVVGDVHYIIDELTKEKMTHLIRGIIGPLAQGAEMRKEP